MSNPTITHVNNQPLVYETQKSETHKLTLTDATVSRGSILARDTSTLKWVPFVVSGSTNGNGIPRGILLNTVTVSGTGDAAVDVLTAGRVNFNKLIIIADGDNSNITKLHLDTLQGGGVFVDNPTQLVGLDNS